MYDLFMSDEDTQWQDSRTNLIKQGGNVTIFDV